MEQNQINLNQTNEQTVIDSEQINMFSENKSEQNEEAKYDERDLTRADMTERENQNKTALNANVDLSAINNREDAENYLKSKGLDYSELQKEFSETGMISKESREKLLQMGISDEFTDNYIEGQKARMNAELDEISKCIGGRKNMDTVINWAGMNLAKDEILSINNVHDKNLMKIILKELKMRMDENEGITPRYIKGEGSGTTSDKFRSKAEMFEAINNPKYRKDDAYRRDVRMKITNSMNAGIDLGI